MRHYAFIELNFDWLGFSRDVFPCLGLAGGRLVREEICRRAPCSDIVDQGHL